MLFEIETTGSKVEYRVDKAVVAEHYWEWLRDIYVNKLLVNAVDLGSADINKEVVAFVMDGRLHIKGILAEVQDDNFVLVCAHVMGLGDGDDEEEFLTLLRSKYGSLMRLSGGSIRVFFEEVSRSFIQRDSTEQLKGRNDDT